MIKVYLVNNVWEYYATEALFSSKEKAKRYIDAHVEPDNYIITEMVMDEWPYVTSCCSDTSLKEGVDRPQSMR